MSIAKLRDNGHSTPPWVPDAPPQISATRLHALSVPPTAAVQCRLWTRDYSPQPPENIGLVPQYFALALTDIVVEAADGGVGPGAGPDLGQRVELASSLFGLRCDVGLGLGFRGAVGHPWESAPSCTALNRGPSGLGKTRTRLDRDAGAGQTNLVSVCRTLRPGTGYGAQAKRGSESS